MTYEDACAPVPTRRGDRQVAQGGHQGRPYSAPRGACGALGAATIFRIAMLALVLPALLPLPAAAADVEMLSDGGFEQGGQGWAAYAGAWQVVASPAHSGGHAAALSTANDNAWLYQWADVYPGGNYSFDGWAWKNDPAVEKVYLRLTWYDASGAKLISITSASELTSDLADYRHVIISATAPPAAVRARLDAVLVPQGTGPATVYFDDLSFLLIADMVADTSLGQSVDSQGIVRVDLNVDGTRDMASGIPVSLEQGLAAYEVRWGYDRHGVSVLRVDGVPPFEAPDVEIILESTQGTLISRASHTASVGPSKGPLAHVAMRLTGLATTTYGIRVDFASLSGVAEGPISVNSTPREYRRGDADGSNSVDIADALLIAQYLARLRPLSDINAVNAASVRYDGDEGDRITIADALFIAQYVAELREADFQ